jgi:dolichyl-phosphate-mannose-protein mannosyltransferase
VMVRTARRLTGSTLLGVVGGLLMCFDGLQLVLSRLALLDIFQAFFVLAAVSCLVADRDWGRARLATLAPDGVDPLSWGPVRGMLLRPWRVLAGVWLGLGLGTKWSTIFVLAAFGLLVWAWDAGARRRLGVHGSVWKSAVADALPAFGWLVLLPAVVYLATWTGWLLHADQYEKYLSHTQYGPYWGSYLKHRTTGFFPETFRALRDLWHYHHDVYSFHTGKGLQEATHIYQSNPGGWLILNRPVGVDAQLGILPGQQGCTAPSDSTCLRQVLLLGNPAIWWGGTLAFAYAFVGWVARRDWRYGIVVVGVLVTWLPWLRYDNRPIFSYYAIVIEPFLIIGLVLVLGRILGTATTPTVRRRVGAVVGGAYVVVVVALFAWFWPIWTDQVITTPHWLQRIWFHRWI